MKILVTGGAGYIGSHTCLQLLAAGHQVVVLDNLSNSQLESINRIRQISGLELTFIEGDICDENTLKSIFTNYNIEAVVHFAGYKSVGESNEKPLIYYENNVIGSITLFKVMAELNVKNIVFSSSATVYGEPESVPIIENFPLTATNPYGRTKLMIEEILRDLYIADSTWKISILRYFNPIGAHESGLIGENPNGTPNNLLPYISQVAVGKLKKLRIFGNDYPTTDGTGVRDYIHVMDLADGHLAALNYLSTISGGIVAVNLGTGIGYSVLDVVNEFSRASNINVEYEFLPRRTGDIATCYADTTLAKKLLGWEAKRNLATMCSDAWRWQSLNPNGY